MKKLAIALLIVTTSLFTGCNPFRKTDTYTFQGSDTTKPILATNAAGQVFTRFAPVETVTLTPVAPPNTNGFVWQPVPARTNSTYDVAPGVANGLDTAKGLTSLIPPPYSAPAEAALALGTVLLGWIVRQKNIAAGNAQDAAAVAQENASLAQAVNRSIVAGVETYGALNPGSNIKDIIATHANAAGVQDALHTIVSSVSESHPELPPAPAVSSEKAAALATLAQAQAKLAALA